MINIRIKRDEQRRIIAFTVEGHALFAEEGNDIVCAGVSAVSVGAVNAAEVLTGTALECEMRKGLLKADVPRDKLTDDKSDSLQLILESMVVMLQTIVHSYGEYVQIFELNHTSKGG